MINPIPFLTVLIVDHRVVEIINMAGSFPGGRMHEASGIDTDDVLIHAGHTVPPVTLEIFSQFTAPLAIIIYCLEAVIDFAAGKNKAIFFRVRDNCLEPVAVICHMPSLLALSR